MKRLLCQLTLCMWLASFGGGLTAQDKRSMQTPKVAVTADGSTAYIAQYQSGKIVRLRSSAFDEAKEFSTDAMEPVVDNTAVNIVDMVVSNNTGELLLACDGPPRLIRQPLAGGDPTTITLAAPPERIALTKEADGKQFMCVSLPSTLSVWLGVLSDNDQLAGGLLALTFAPKEVIPLGESLFVVADAFGSRIALVDAQTREMVKHFGLNGYHLAGLAIDAPTTSLLVTHQVLSSNARTEEDDIRWGSLIQNNVAAIPLPSLAGPSSRLTTDTIYRLGEFGHGAADPAGVVAMGDRLAVAISGTDEVALYSKPQRQAKFVTVGRVPERLFKFGEDRLLCVHRLDRRVAVINCKGETPKLERMLGDEQPLTTAQQRGELAYFSGQLSHEGWMSCNSCHIEGGSPDLLVDTLGDGTYDSPKKIPSLENVAHTGPWAWHGGQLSLAEQISKTLASTMHTPDQLPESTGLVRETLVDDLLAYLEPKDASPGSLNLNPEPKDASPGSLAADQPTGSEVVAKVAALTKQAQDAVRAGGAAVFQQHCARCHDPDQYFTSSRTYDVGINDERGQKQFNPPSLIGVARRTKYMHDGRFNSLKQVLTSHPQPANTLSSEAQYQLQEYLKGL